MAMIMRAYSLKYITANQYSYLMKQMSIKGYRLVEPLDDSIEFKHPHALHQAIDLLMTKGEMSGDDIMNLFSSNGFTISTDVVEELLNLKNGTLANHNNDNIVELFMDRR